MAPSRRAASSQPPRPPNAWIIYRSHKIQELPPPPPGEPRRAQADVSKLLSSMWKSEPPNVRAFYERAAEDAKAEHQARYPGYRFQPMKKEDKERMKSDKKKVREKERAEVLKGRSRAAPYPTASTPAPMQHGVQMFNPGTFYGAAGPSPPMSAAPSPNNASPYPDSQHGSDEFPHPAQQAYATPSSSSGSQPNSGSEPSVSNVSSPIYPTLMLPYGSNQPSQLSLAASNTWQAMPQLQQPSIANGTVEASNWTQPSTSQTPPQESSNDDLNNSITFNNIPSLDNFSGWLTGESSDLPYAIPTDDPSVFELGGLDFNNFLTPGQELEVSMGSQQVPFDLDQQAQNYADLFANFDFSSVALPQPPLSLDDASISPSQLLTSPPDPAPIHPHTPAPQSNGSNSRVSSYGSQQQDFGAFEQDSLFHFFNFDANTGASTSQEPSSQPAAPLQQQPSYSSNTPQPQAIYTPPYVPPAGAAFSSTRRVGASWKQRFPVPDSPVEHTTPSPWSVPAS